MDKFVLQVPKWQGELLFSKELIVFLGVILLMIVGTLFCFWGYKYFKAVLFLGIGVVVCYGSYLLVEPMTANLVIRMFLTVSLTFLGICFVYFLDIVFGYLLDRLGIRGALGKRVYLAAAPLGAAILGLTIYFYIWRDAVVALGIALCCLVPGLVFQHHKRKKMIRFRCYNDLLKLRRPKFDEDGLEILSDGTAGAALATAEPEQEPEPMPEPEPEPVPVMAAKPELIPEPEPVPVMAAKPELIPEPEPVPVMATEPEPMPEPEPVPVIAAEPEPAPVPVMAMEPEPAFEPEPVFMMNAGQRALSEIESEFASESEYGMGILPEQGPSKPAAENVASAAEQAEPEAAPAPVPFEISDDVKELILRKMETDEELLEEAFFVKKISKKMAAKQEEERRKTETQGSVTAEKKADEDIRIEKITPVYPGKITITKKDRKSRRRREEGIAKGAAIAAAGLGAFLAGRITKGGD